MARVEAEDWEGIAAELLEESGCDDPPVDAFVLAGCCDLEVRAWMRGHAELRENRVIRYPVGARPVRQHGLIAHEIGHWALRRGGVDDTEEGARYLAGALMLPRRAFDRDLTSTRWAMDALRAKHLNASAEMIARRIVQLRDAVATVVDNDRVRSRVSSAWLPDPRLKRITKWERSLVDAALESGDTVHGAEFCYAVPLLDPPWQRVIVVCEAEQLSLRL